MLLRSASEAVTFAAVVAAAITVVAVAQEPTGLPVARFEWPRATPAEMGMDRGKLEQARAYAEFKREDPHAGGSAYIIRKGNLVMAWGSPKQLYEIKSASKSVGITALGLAIQDGRMRLSDTAKQFHLRLGVPPAKNAATGWIEKITLEHLATQTAGFDRGHGFEALLYEPGTKWAYSDGGPDWLGECITLEYRRDVKEILFERVFTTLGITEADLTWRTVYNRPEFIEGVRRREFGSGIRANVDALARIGYLYLRGGEWGGKQLIPKTFVETVRTTPRWLKGLPLLRQGNPGASNHYGLLWWNNSDGAMRNVPTDTFFAWGGMQGRDTETLIVVFPSLEIVVARSGTGWGDGTIDYKFLEPFIRPIAESVSAARGSDAQR